MPYMDDAVEAVRAAERAVAKLLSDAGAAQEWEDAAKLTELGRNLRAIVDSSIKIAPEVGGSGPAALPETHTSGKVSKPATRRIEYPHFFRENESLVKVAWSKTQRSEYEHKASYKIISLLIDALMKAGARGRRFTMDKILPVHDVDSGADVPEYQVYVALAWLKAVKVIEQHGRSGYTLARQDNVAEIVAKCWAETLTR